MFTHFLEILFPYFCVQCKKFGEILCQDCFGKIEFVKLQVCPYCLKPSIDGLTHPNCLTPWGIDGILTAVFYKAPIPKLVSCFKYGRYPLQKISDVFAKILLLYFSGEEEYFPGETIVTAVPLHWFKKRKRGYNQAEILAEIIACHWQLNADFTLLQKVSLGKPQIELKKVERIGNIRGAFIIRRDASKKIKGKKILVVDDVCTTGATLKECAKVLKRAGVKNVWGITLARG